MASGRHTETEVVVWTASLTSQKTLVIRVRCLPFLKWYLESDFIEHFMGGKLLLNCITLYLQDSQHSSVPHTNAKLGNLGEGGSPILQLEKVKAQGNELLHLTMSQKRIMGVEPELQSISYHTVLTCCLSVKLFKTEMLYTFRQALQTVLETSSSKRCPFLSPFAHPYPLTHVSRKLK